MINKVFLAGYLGRDPEIRYTPSGSIVASFSMATSASWTVEDGSRKEKVEWHNVVAWGKLADVCEKYMKKGTLVHVEGRLQTQTWEDKDGNQRSKVEIIAAVITLLGPKETEQTDRADKQEQREPLTKPEDTEGTSLFDDDDDIPF